MSTLTKILLSFAGIVSVGITVTDFTVSTPTSTPSPTPRAKAAITVQEKELVSPILVPAQITPTPTSVIPTQVPLSNNNYYTNSVGNEVHSPAYADTVPIGASAQCRDGTYSFSQSRRGTCSHHGGVARWL